MKLRVLNWAPVAAIGLVVAILVAIQLGDDASGYRVRAMFSDATGLRKNSEVRINGVAVGKVQRLELGPHDEVVAELSVERGAGPIGAGARAHLRAKNLLGAKQVDLDPGDLTRPQPSGTTIPVRRTDTPVDLDQVLDVLSPDVRTRLRVLIHESGVALDGRGSDFNKLLAQLPSALDSSRRLVDQVDGDNLALKRLLTQSDRLVGSVTEQRRSLGDLVDNAAVTLQSTVERHRQLAATIQQAPGAVTQLRRTFAKLERTVAPLRPAARSLTASAAPLTGVLKALPSLTPIAVKTLDATRRVAPSLTRLADGTTPLVRRLKPTAAQLAETATLLAPVSGTLERVAPDALAVLEAWARAIQTRDGLGHVFRGSLTLSHELTSSLIERFVHPQERAATPTRDVATSPRPATRPSTPAGGPKDLLQRLGGGPGRLNELPKALQELPSVVQEALDDVLHPGRTGTPPAKGPGDMGAASLLDFLLGS
jgi:phospholipid/cholesterol/gamma-HCH transport system substrate-binding protein